MKFSFLENAVEAMIEKLSNHLTEIRQMRFGMSACPRI